MVTGTCAQVSDSVTDERRFERLNLANNTSVSINGRVVEVKIRNFSCGGMMIELVKGMIGTDAHQEVLLQFADVTLRGFLRYEPFYKTHRIIFSAPLEKVDFDAIAGLWEKGQDYSGDMVRIYNIVSASMGRAPVNHKSSPV
jgi:hypothetical protein